jgi:hypothetical protein
MPWPARHHVPVRQLSGVGFGHNLATLAEAICTAAADGTPERPVWLEVRAEDDYLPTCRCKY